MKKIIAVMLVFVIIFCCSACKKSSQVKDNTSVYSNVTSSNVNITEKIEISNVVEKTKEEAISILEGQGFEVSVVEQFDPNSKVGMVLKQQPEANTEILTGSNVVIYVSKKEQTVTVKYDATGGNLNEGQKVYNLSDSYGNLPVPTKTGYVFDGWYTAASGGKLVISENVMLSTADHTLFAHWSPSDCKINIVCKSYFGTDLGSTSTTGKFGATTTITPPDKEGYTTPNVQEVTCDSMEEKTLTFLYAPAPVKTQQLERSGTWYAEGKEKIIGYLVTIDYSERTKTSVKIKIKWTNRLYANTAYPYNQWFNITVGGKSTGDTLIANAKTFTGTDSLSGKGTGATITIPLKSTDKQELQVVVNYWDSLTRGSFTGKITIPAY